MDSSNESEMKQSHHVLDPQDRREEDLPSQPHTPQKLPVNRNQKQQREDESKDGGSTPSKQSRCKCKFSRCLKLYCECFASGSYCNGCNCLNCHNTLEKEAERREAIKAILERNPDAFKPKIAAGSPHGLNDLQEDVSQPLTLVKHRRGCNCKRSGCLMKYCECYQANVRCSENCRCRDCKNFEGSQDLLTFFPNQEKQTANNETDKLLAIDMSGYMDLPQSKKIKAASHRGSSAFPHLPQSKKIKAASRRGSSAFPHLPQNQTVKYVLKDCEISIFPVPNIKAVSESTTSTYGLAKIPNIKAGSESTTSTYGSSLSDTMKPRDVKELCSLLVSKSVEVANKKSDCVLDAVRTGEKHMPPATRALMCDEEHVNISENETFAPERTSQEKDRSSEVYAEQEKQILTCFRDHLFQFLKHGSISGTNIQKANTDPSRKEPEDEEQSHRDSSLGD